VPQELGKDDDVVVSLLLGSPAWASKRKCVVFVDTIYTPKVDVLDGHVGRHWPDLFKEYDDLQAHLAARNLEVHGWVRYGKDFDDEDLKFHSSFHEIIGGFGAVVREKSWKFLRIDCVGSIVPSLVWAEGRGKFSKCKLPLVEGPRASCIHLY
jgi:hypothetical protein